MNAPELILLGTGTPVPDPLRAGAGVAIVERDRWILIDCGRGITQRVMEAELDLLRLTAVFLTHHHTDHISDLPTLAIARWVAGAGTPLEVYAPNGPCSEYARRCLDIYDNESFYGQAPNHAGGRPIVNVHDHQPTVEPSIVHRCHQLTIASARVDHPPISAAVGYRVTTKHGSIAVSGDTAVGPGITLLAEKATWLVHEAVRSDIADQTLLSWNAGAKAVGQLAKRASVNTLILTHLLPRPRSKLDEQTFAREATEGGFDGEVIVAQDGLRIPLGRPASTLDSEH